MRSLSFALALLLWPTAAFAQVDQTAAEAAFQAGLQQMDAKQYPAACESFGASDAIDSTMSTQFQLGRCHEEQQHFALARQHYGAAAKKAEDAGDAKAAGIAKKRAASLDARVGRVVLVVPPQHRVAGLAITRNGRPYPEAEWNQPIELDAGPLQVHASAPAHRPVDFQDAVVPGQVKQLALPPLPPEGAALPPPGAGATAEGETERRNPALFITGISLTAAGGAAIIGAVVATAVEPCATCDVQPATIGLGVAGLACAGAGIPLLIIFGKKVPAGSSGGGPRGPSAIGASLEPLLTPSGMSIRGRF